MIVSNIQWDIDIEDVLAAISKMPKNSVTEVIGIPFTSYADMSTEDKKDYIRLRCGHDKAEYAKIIGLPDEIEILDDVDDENIFDWLSDRFGFCCEEYYLEEKEDRFNIRLLLKDISQEEFSDLIRYLDKQDFDYEEL